MKKLLIMALVGGGLFIGTVLGLLSASGRLDYKGTRGIPILESFFSDPDAKDDAEAEKTGDEAEHSAENENPETEFAIAGPGLSEPEPAGGGGHGGGHAAPGGETHQSGIPDVVPSPKIEDPRFDADKQNPQLSGGSRYFPGGFFRFPSRNALAGAAGSGDHDASDVPIEDELNRRLEALKVRQTRLNERTTKVELDEKGLIMRRMDVVEREALVKRKDAFIETNRDALMVEIKEFQKHVILIKPEEMAGLRTYAKELEGMAESDPDKARMIVLGLLGLPKVVIVDNGARVAVNDGSGVSRAEAERRKLHMMKALSLMSPDAFGTIIATMKVDEIMTIFKDKLKVSVEGKK